jgi:predicted GNAT family acetyltransferase
VNDHPLRLSVGSHKAGSGRGCAMNVISWENGDSTITDFPSCSDQFLSRLVQRINDGICTHRDGDFLCPSCSAQVLELGHRTVGTALDWPAAKAARLYADIAQWCAADAAYVGGANAAARSARSADAAYVGDAAADAAYAAADAAKISFYHRVIDEFISRTGVAAVETSTAVTTAALQKMLAK